ncbi:hypothetical protein [Paracoccus sediminilitoris]|uniref:hypothetical protein n=1 Tax=Paracoccus sediminilitoris TaxID=2202419 RepID=UPI00272C3866|nr:hypothetical protein [Paracoccus sediminilitoris]
MFRVFMFMVLVWTGQGAMQAHAAEPAAGFCDLSPGDFAELHADDTRARRVVCAEVGALDQMLVYNRFGSHNPFGMIFALMRDLVPASAPVPDDILAACADDIGAHARRGNLSPGLVRLHDCKRPRPLTLRANVGDVLHVRVHNLLRFDAAQGRPDYSQTFCRAQGEGRVTGDHGIRDLVSQGSRAGADGTYTDSLVQALCAADSAAQDAQLGSEPSDWPRTRGISFVIDGLRPLHDPRTGKVDDICMGLNQLGPDSEPVDCFWHAEREGPYFINSVAAASGGEGDGGSLTHGLFGSLTVEPQAPDRPATQWYVSQTSRAGMDAAWPPNLQTDQPHDRASPMGYDARAQVDGESLPVLNILAPRGGARHEIVHNTLNAIVHAGGEPAFREFSVVFHDELKTFYTRNFEELERFPQLAGVSDGFAINYGASGLGAMILANRKGIGPAADCMECLYEEFFLESWVNGDPALLEVYADDPSNVHHSYLNDPIVFQNFHAGPKETHVFHLHAHQWFGGNDAGRGAYLDSQTVAPRQGFSYRIYHGGLSDYRPPETAGDPPSGQGWWETLGSGNRNRTVGDSIFHCHLYPHFAQGMWELWRVHDVFEDGSRKLPDGQEQPGLSTELLARDPQGRLDAIKPRPGSVDAQGRFVADAAGTPIPAIVPLPDRAAPLLPTYADDAGEVTASQAVPGYPFFVAGQPGHRAPQAPMDIAETDGVTGGGLRRHVVTSGSERKLGIALPAADMAIAALTGQDDRRRVEDLLYRATAKMLALGDFSGHLARASIRLLDSDGQPLERGAMAFHHNGRLEGGDPVALRDAYGRDSSYDTTRGGYVSAAPGAPVGDPPAMRFAVNGAPPKPGAPFADPCGAPDALAGRDPGDPDRGHPTAAMAMRGDPFDPDRQDFVPDPAVTGFRRYAASAVQVDIVTNKAGWHDPQGRINVLTSQSDRYKTLGPSAREEPFFFRAFSGECIQFRHTNELPKELELDDFQVQTPTDTIGQHIHLVKFDVTSADGSGNGWNYEDGTFAADELATRLCAWGETGDPQAQAILTDLADRVRATLATGGDDLPDLTPEMAFCEWEPVAAHRIWSLERSRFPYLFQTTIQRWFADPILSVEDPDDPTAKADRTMRTVFSHDHFGPSSIQQHGFYSALVIEPAGKRVCSAAVGGDGDCMATDPTAVVEGGTDGIGTHKLVTGGPDDELHPDYREFALAIADFALLYDPTDGDGDDIAAAAGQLPSGAMLTAPQPEDQPSPKGLARLVCEAEHRTATDPEGLLESRCAAHLDRDTIAGSLQVVEGHDAVPAMVARDLIEDTEVPELRRHMALVRYRAGYGQGLARPVNAPARPESISVDHHDPYLVNYRGEPVPLRIGQTAESLTPIAMTTEDDGEAPGEGASDAARTAFDCFLARQPDIVLQFSRRDLAMPGPAPDDAPPVPGLPVADGAALDQRLAGAGSLNCSIDTQSADPRGNMAHVYRSEFLGPELQPADAPAAEPLPTGTTYPSDETRALIRNRVHGDPVTPLLETYSDERVQIRLIQGAQEVQHSFTLEGLQWRRQIDQRYPATANVLATDLAQVTWAEGCRTRASDSIARQHDRWRRGMLNSGDDTDFWDGHSRLVALCDNVESFVAAQEVGISEHFEIPAAPSKHSVQFRALQDRGSMGDTAALDYMFHFGSLDAIWNGAWGLMRVYDNPGSRDETRRLEDAAACAPNDPGCTIDAALRPLPETRAGTDAGRGDIPVRQGMDCPMNAPRIRAYAVAMPLPQGQRYASWADGFRDPNGLALIHVPQAMVTPWLASGVPADQIGALRSAALRHYRDQPMVIRANAGDCLNLTIVNAMAPVTDQPCGHAPNGIPGPVADCLGDAPMPRIVKLNLEPDWSEADAATGIRHQADRVDVRPSARIAFTTALSMLTRGGEAHLPYGVNRAISVAPGQVHRADYYLGLLRVDWRLIDHLMESTTIDTAPGAPNHPVSNALQACTRLEIAPPAIEGSTGDAITAARRILQGSDPDFYVMTHKDPAPRNPTAGQFPIEILGTTYWGHVQQRRRDARILPPGTLENAAQMTVDCAIALLDRKGLGAGIAGQPASHPDPNAAALSAIPYAFGAVPLKPMGDLFNHLPHGLFGSLVVEPQGATYPGRPTSADGSGEYAPAGPGFRGLAHRGRGDNTVISFVDADGTARRIREFVLFYQDGLNLWDSRSGERHLAIDAAPDGPFLPIVENCIVCDDSYDLGEKAVSYLSPAFHRRLRQTQSQSLQADSDLNAQRFEDDFRAQKDSLSANSLRLWAHPGEEVLIRVIHPGGRARQRAFVTVGNDYDDLVPGFGFPHAALLAPGKAISAAFAAPVRSGCYLWGDGPRQIEASGVWGVLDVLDDGGATSCGFQD